MIIQTPNLRINGTLTNGNYPNKIILHHPEWDGTAQDLNEMEIENTADPMIMSGYNYYVRKDGSVYAMRPVWAVGANCYGQNHQSIGVAAEGNFMTDIMSAAQKESIIQLCQWLKLQYPDVTEVGPHKKYYNTDCPGVNYPVNDIINAINNPVIHDGWCEIAGTWYYFENKAKVINIWEKDSKGLWYFLGGDGSMTTNRWIKTTDGKQYWVGADGAMVTNTVIDGWTVGADGAWDGKAQVK